MWSRLLLLAGIAKTESVAEDRMLGAKAESRDTRRFPSGSGQNSITAGGGLLALEGGSATYTDGNGPHNGGESAPAGLLLVGRSFTRSIERIAFIL